MVKVMGNLKRWLTREEIQEMLNWSPENIDLLINGLSKSIATTSDGLILINLNNLYNYLFEVKKMTNPLLKGSASKKIKKPKAEKKQKAENNPKAEKKPKPERMNRKKRVEAGQLTGRQAADKLKCSYKAVIELIKKHGLKAAKFGRGWYIKPEDLEEFSSKNRDIIRSVSYRPETEENNKEEETVKEETVEQKIQEPPAQEEKKEPEPPAEDAVTAVPDAVKTKENIILVSPSEDPGQDKDAAKESVESEDQPLVQEKAEEPKNNGKKENKREERPVSFVTIRKHKYGCKVGDVAFALHLAVSTPMRWISDQAVKTVSAPGINGAEVYIESESLRDFLLKERNTEVTFDETKSFQWPGLAPTPAR